MEDLPKTLPASWYRSVPLYNLERRAIFLKAWHFLGPITRFVTVGEKVDYEIAQVPFYVQRMSDQPRDIKIFSTETGHELRHHLTQTGALFCAVSDSAPTFHQFFPDLEPLLAKVDFTKLPYRRSIKYPGRFNWKTMVDGYQECLHCQYTHPSFSKFYPPAFYTVRNHSNFSEHIADPAKYNPEDGLFLYFYPICTVSVYAGGMHTFRVCPTERPGITRMEFDYFHTGNEEVFEEYFKFTRQVGMEDFELCERAQENLEKGVYDVGILNPVKETGVAYYQQKVLGDVIAQHEMDKQRLDQEDNEEGEQSKMPLSPILVSAAEA